LFQGLVIQTRSGSKWRKLVLIKIATAIEKALLWLRQKICFCCKEIACGMGLLPMLAEAEVNIPSVAFVANTLQPRAPPTGSTHEPQAGQPGK
jgi:hypothetical protein